MNVANVNVMVHRVFVHSFIQTHNWIDYTTQVIRTRLYLIGVLKLVLKRSGFWNVRTYKYV